MVATSNFGLSVWLAAHKVVLAAGLQNKDVLLEPTRMYLRRSADNTTLWARFVRTEQPIGPVLILLYTNFFQNPIQLRQAAVMK